MAERILIVDDERQVVELCSRALTRMGYHPSGTSSPAQALELMRQERFDLLITDLMMPGTDGLDLMTQAREIDPDIPSVAITGYGTIDLAIRALRAGAHDFLAKPFTVIQLRETVERVLAQVRVLREHVRLRALLPLFELGKRSFRDISMEDLLSQVVDIAMSETGADGAVLLLGGNEPDAAGSVGSMQLSWTKGVVPAPMPDYGKISALLSAREEVVVVDAGSEASSIFAEGMQAAALSALLCAPFRALARFAGVLCLSRLEGGRAFQRGDVEMITVLSSQAAALLANARLVKQLDTWNVELERRVAEATRRLVDAQSKLVRSERLAAIGQLGASVAHELRNPLGVISNSVYYLRNRLASEDTKINKHLDIIGYEVQAANRSIADLMSFVRVGELRTASSEPNVLVQSAIERCAIPSGVQVHTELAEGLPQLQVDSEKIQQVFVNLIDNASQAMPDGGDLVVSTFLGDGMVHFAFRDTGVGIRAEDLERVFEPLFTTKAKGFGLGLSIAQLLVDAHHGRISVASEVQYGSCFTVALPYVRTGGSLQ